MQALVQRSGTRLGAVRSSNRARVARPCGPAPGRPHPVAVQAGKVRKVTPEELEVAIANRDKTLVVDFFATWCGPCLLLAQELEKVAAEFGDAIEVLKLDVDENPDLASQLQIAGLPTMIFIGTDDSKPALRSEGLMTADTIKNILKKDLKVVPRGEPSGEPQGEPVH